MHTYRIESPYHTPAYQALKKQIETDQEFCLALSASLMVAHRVAYADLDPDLYHALDDVFDGEGWPVTPEAYLRYVAKYLVLIPNEVDDPDYPLAWTSDDEVNGYNQKIYDLLCQFYFLVDQPIPGGGTLQDYENGDFVFADWLREFARDWGSFLNTEDSFPLWAQASFIADPMYNYPLYSDNEDNWKSFNDFFSRQFNCADEKGHTPLRPIAEPGNNNAITAPADCTYKDEYGIDELGNVVGIDGSPTVVNLKGTHSVYTVAELLQDDKLAARFHGGTFVHYFLSPFDYHRFHAPVGGKVKECKAVVGSTYLNVDMTPDGQFDAPDGAEDGYEFTQARGVIVIDAGDPVGLVAAIPVGMCQVSGVHMKKKLKGKKIAKGDEFGHFLFGGSDIILLFEKNPELYLWTTDPGHNPIHFQFGQVAAYWDVDAQQ